MMTFTFVTGRIEMPFDSIEQAKKKHPNLSKYSEKAQRGWLKSINQCFSDGGDDGKCFPIAYSVANKVDGKKASTMRRGQFIRADFEDELFRMKLDDGWIVFRNGDIAASINLSWHPNNRGGKFESNQGGFGIVDLALPKDIKKNDTEEMMKKRNRQVSFEEKIKADKKSEFVSEAKMVIKSKISNMLKKELGSKFSQIPITKTRPRNAKAKDDAMTPEESARRQKKVKAIRNLAENLGRLKTCVNKDLKSDEEKDQLTALVIWIMDRTAERVGNEESAKEGHIGVTGLKCKNVTVDGNTVKLNYVGKSGVDHEKDFTDKRVAPMIKTLIDRCENPGDSIFVTSGGFKIKADRVNRYLKDFGVKSKDIRGFAANRFMEQTLKRTEKPSDEAERKKVFLNALKTVSDRVGHTAATLRTHYLLPDVEDAYIRRGRVLSPTTASSKTASTTKIDKNVDIDVAGNKVTVEASVWFTGADYDDFIKSMAITIRKVKSAISELANSFDLDMMGYKLFADKGRVRVVGLLSGGSELDKGLATKIIRRASVKFFVLSESYKQLRY